MTTGEIITAAISAVTGGGLASYFTFRQGTRQSKLDEFKAVVDEYKEFTDNLQSEVKELRAEIDIIRKEGIEKDIIITTMKAQIAALEGSTNTLPIPAWLTDLHGRFIDVNKEYELEILSSMGVDKETYLKKGGNMIWGEETAKWMENTSKQVILSKKPMAFSRSWIGVDGHTYKVYMIKHLKEVNGVKIGVQGVITHMSVSNGTVKHFYGPEPKE